jgi:hypothetical protein
MKPEHRVGVPRGRALQRALSTPASDKSRVAHSQRDVHRFDANPEPGGIEYSTSETAKLLAGHDTEPPIGLSTRVSCSSSLSSLRSHTSDLYCRVPATFRPLFCRSAIYGLALPAQL